MQKITIKILFLSFSFQTKNKKHFFLLLKKKPFFFLQVDMEIAISALVTALLSDYAPIESIAVKIAVGSLLSRLIEKYLPDINVSIFKHFLCCKRRYISTLTIDVRDIFTAHAIDVYLLNINTKRLKLNCPPHTNKNEENLLWDYDQIGCGTGYETLVTFEGICYKLIKMPKDANKTNDANNYSSRKSKTHLAADTDNLATTEQKTLFSISASCKMADMQSFIFHIQSLMPNALNVYRKSFSIGKSPNRYHNNDVDEDRYEDHRMKKNENEDFESIFFNKLEHYFLQRDVIRCANLGYQGKESVLGVNPFSFTRSALYDTFEGCEVKILFVANNQSLKNNCNNQTLVYGQLEQIHCLRFESNELSVSKLREYTHHIYRQMLAIEGKAILQRFVRIHEVESHGTKRLTASWKSTCVATSKTFRNTILSESVQKDFIDDLQIFLTTPQYYVERGIPYKRTYLLHGLPGSGKSSSIKAVAREHGLEVFTCNLENMTNNQFESLMTEMDFKTQSTPHILLFEDADRSKIFNYNKTKNARQFCYSRSADEDSDDDNDDNAENNAKNKKNMVNQPVSMAALLNVMDGLKEPYGRITIFTMNNAQKFLKARKNIASFALLKTGIEEEEMKGKKYSKPKKMNPLEAFMRPGRIDKVVEIGYCTKQQIKLLYKLYYPMEPDLEESKICDFEKLSPAQLSETLMQCNNALTAKNIVYGTCTDNGEECKKPVNIVDNEAKIVENVQDISISPISKVRKCKRKSKKIIVEEQNGLPTLATVIREAQRLKKSLHGTAAQLERGDAAVLQWHEKSNLWLKKLTLADSVYNDILERFVTSQSTEETKKKRGRPKKVISENNENQDINTSSISESMEEQKIKTNTEQIYAEQACAKETQEKQEENNTCVVDLTITPQREVKDNTNQHKQETQLKKKQKLLKEKQISLKQKQQELIRSLKHRNAPLKQIREAVETLIAMG